MRPSLSIVVSLRTVACMCAALVLLFAAAAAAGASEAQNPFGGAAQTSSQAAKPAVGAAKPATGAAKLTPQEKQKLTSEAEKQIQSKLGGARKQRPKQRGRKRRNRVRRRAAR